MVHLIVVPGINGSGPTHWQTLWEASISAASEGASTVLGPITTSRIAPASWDEPGLQDWLAAIDRAVDAAPLAATSADTGARTTSPIVFVAHSLGCLAVSEWASTRPEPIPIAGALLVAPPDNTRVSFPAEADDFRSIVAATLPFPALLVTSTTDPYCSTDMADALADAWGARHVSLGDLGHLNANSGVGDWPAGRQLLREFVTEVAGA